MDNQLRILSNYKNLSNEKCLIQQFNALSQELDLLKMHLIKINKLLSETITEKCKQELIHEQEQQQQLKCVDLHLNSGSVVNGRGLAGQHGSYTDSSNLFRASLVPVGNINNSINVKSASSVWKLNSPNINNNKKSYETSGHFNSIDNLSIKNSNPPLSLPLTNQSSKFIGNISGKNSQNGSLANPNYNHAGNENYYYLKESNYIKANMLNGITKLDHNMSKSIDSLYPTTSSSSPKHNKEHRPISHRKTALLDLEDHFNDTNYKSSFQPISFIPNHNNQSSKEIFIDRLQLHQPHQYQNQASSLNGPLNKNSSIQTNGNNFKRETVAEKKRASIGKYPHTYNTVIQVSKQQQQHQNGDYFQPIVVTNQPTARERLFGLTTSNNVHFNNGNVNNSGNIQVLSKNLNNSHITNGNYFNSNETYTQSDNNMFSTNGNGSDVDQSNRKIAFVRPELRGSYVEK
jgi:hypothetical protein